MTAGKGESGVKKRGDVYVEVYCYATGEVGSVMGPMSPSKADRVMCGAVINMSDEWSARIVKKPTKTKMSPSGLKAGAK